MTDRLQVFISSTFGDLQLEREYVEEVLRQMGIEPLLFPEDSVAGTAKNAFLRKLDEADLLVYIATRKSKWLDLELSRATELGLPVIELAERSHDRSGRPAAPSRHAQERRASIPHFQREFGSLKELRQGVEKGVAAAIARRFSSATSMRPLGDDVYYFCQEYVERAQQHLGIVQRTASCLLGARRDRLEEEGRFLHALRRRLEGIIDASDTTLEIAYIFDRDATLNELRTRPSSYPGAREAISWLRDFAVHSGPRIRIVAVSSGITPLVLQDATLSVTVNLGRSFWFEQEESGRNSPLTWDQLVNASNSSFPLRPVLEEALSVVETFEAYDMVELIDDSGATVGTAGKLEAHELPGQLHKGFSIFLFDESGRTLLQRRANAKYHFAGKWSNACCSHPPVGFDLIAAARRRLQYELGIDTNLQFVGSFRYEAIDTVSHRIEREDDAVLVGYVPGDSIVAPSSMEVSATRFVGVEDLLRELDDSGGEFAPWLREAMTMVTEAGHPAPRA